MDCEFRGADPRNNEAKPQIAGNLFQYTRMGILDNPLRKLENRDIKSGLALSMARLPDRSRASACIRRVCD